MNKFMVTWNMKKTIYFMFVCIVTNNVYSQNPENKPLGINKEGHSSTLNVMTFNVRYDEPRDSLQNWKCRKDFVANIIHFYDIDILGTQEALNSQRDDLVNRLPDYSVIGVGREDGKEKGEFAAIFYKKDRFEMIKSGTFWLSESPDKVSKGWDTVLERIVTWAIFREKTTGREIAFFNTHFDNAGKKARVESSHLLISRIPEIAGNRPVIVTGDFNSTPGSEVVKYITNPSDKNSLQNSSALAKYTYGPDWSLNGFGRTPLSFRRVIDYIIIKNIKTVDRYGILAEMLNSTYMSDHCPVFVQIEIQ